MNTIAGAVGSPQPMTGGARSQILSKENSMATLSQLINAKAIAIGKLAVRATTAAGSGHPTSALSLAHLIATLMYHTMRWRPEQPRDPGADRLCLAVGEVSARQALILLGGKNQMLRPTAPTARRTFVHLGKTRRAGDGLTTVGLRPPSVSPSPAPFSS